MPDNFLACAQITNSSSELTEEPSVRANGAARVAWLVLNIWPSHFGLPLLITTILLVKSIRRYATFVNMCVTWMIVGFASSILLYAGHQTGPEPPKLLCLIQASILYAQPGMTSLSAFALVFQVFYVVRSAFLEKDPERNKRTLKWTLLILPYVALMVFAVWTFCVGLRDPDLVSRKRRFFYCSVKDSTLTNTITTFSFSVLLVTMTLQVWIAFTVYKHWRILRANNLGEKTGTDLNLAIRTAAFATWIFIGMGLSILSIKAPESAVPDMVLATMGSAVVLVFGSQRDFLRVWLCHHDSSSLARAKRPISPEVHADEKSSGFLSERSDSPSLQEQGEIDRQSRRSSMLCIGRRSRPGLSPQQISRPVLREDLAVNVPSYGAAF